MRGGLVTVASLIRAAAELARARLFLARASGQEIAALASLTAHSGRSGRSSLPLEVRRIAFLVPRVASRLPWRADCLVQALAARRWLATLGHDSRLHLGSRKEGGRMLAHAWLTWQGEVVTGGEIADYAPFVRQDG